MITFADLNERYLQGHLKTRPSYRDYLSIYHRYFAAWTEHPTSFKVFQWHDAHRSIAPHANKGLSYLRALYRWAATQEGLAGQPLWSGVNPAIGIRRHPTYDRERVMDLRELRALLADLDRLNPKYQAFFYNRLLTPSRIKELCEMKRAHVDRFGKWTKPTTKNGRPHTIYIPRQAFQLLMALPVEGEYFFMGCYGRSLTPGAARKMWQRWRKDLGMNDVWLLDFRRTLATYLYRVLKCDDLTAKAVLNHYDGRPVAIYTRLDYDYLALVIQGYADWIDTLRTAPIAQLTLTSVP